MSVLTASKLMTWRTPLVILVCGGAVSALGFGPRSTLGLFLTPMTQAQGWGRDVFSLGLGLADAAVGRRPADRRRRRRPLWRRARAGRRRDCSTAAGLLLMAFGGNSPRMFYLSAGVLVGFGLSGAGFQVVLGAFAKLMPAQWRSLAFGIGTAAGSFGQFLFAPLTILFLREFDWQIALARLRAARGADCAAVDTARDAKHGVILGGGTGDAIAAAVAGWKLSASAAMSCW